MHQNVSSPPSFLSIQTLTEMPRTSTQITQSIIYLPLYPHIDDSGATPLVQAVKNGHVHVVRALLDAGMLSTLPLSLCHPSSLSLPHLPLCNFNSSLMISSTGADATVQTSAGSVEQLTQDSVILELLAAARDKSDQPKESAATEAVPAPGSDGNAVVPAQVSTQPPPQQYIATDGTGVGPGYPPHPDYYADRKSTRLNSSHSGESRMPSSA